jgi:hypothetical protein
MILFVGDKPSKNSDPDHPFKGAACEKRLHEWITTVTNKNYYIINQVDPGFEDLALMFEAVGSPIIALGNNASKALGKISHFKLPHPSGRNRQINDKAYIAWRLEECQSYIETFSCF